MLALGNFAVAHPRLANRDRADASHDLAFRKMAVSHDALMARRGPEIGMLCEKLGNLRLDRLGQQRTPLRRTSVKESVKTPGWASLITLLLDTAYPSFVGEVEALNTTTIRRLIPFTLS